MAELAHEKLLPGTRVYSNFYSKGSSPPQVQTDYIPALFWGGDVTDTATTKTTLQHHIVALPSFDSPLEEAGEPYMVPAGNIIAQSVVQLYASWIQEHAGGSNSNSSKSPNTTPTAAQQLEQCIREAVLWRASLQPPTPPPPPPRPSSSDTAPTLPVLPRGSRVAIIGGGSAGVYAIREALARGLVPTLFEKSSSLGGVWRSDRHWDSLTTNSSRDMMQVAGFPFPFETSSEFPTRAEICRYVTAYATHFELWQYIKMGQEVMEVAPLTPASTAAAAAAAAAGAAAPPPPTDTPAAVLPPTQGSRGRQQARMRAPPGSSDRSGPMRRAEALAAAETGISMHHRTKWRVKTSSTSTSTSATSPFVLKAEGGLEWMERRHNTAVFDAVFIATGQFNTPKLPPPLQPKTRTETETALAASAASAPTEMYHGKSYATRYTGQVLHSRDFRRGSDYAGKNVVVVGLGNSSLDVALECATAAGGDISQRSDQMSAKTVTVACRRGSIMLPIASDSGIPGDKVIVTRFFQYAQPGWLRGLRTMGEAQTVTDAFVKAGMPAPTSGGRKQGLEQRVSNLKQKAAWLQILGEASRSTGGDGGGSSGRSSKGLGGNLTLHPAGVASVGPGKRVTFADGRVLEDVDAVICCTGYDVGSFNSRHGPIFRECDGVLNAVEEYASGNSSSSGGSSSGDGDVVEGTTVKGMNLFRRTMHPVYPSLCFLTQFTGFANEAAVGQLQSRWAVEMLTMPLSTTSTTDRIYKKKYDYYDTAESRWLVKKYDSTATKRIRDARRDNWVQDKLLAESSCSNGSDRSGTRAHSPRSIHEIMRRPAFTLADLHAECEKRSQFWKRSGPLFPGFVTVVKFMDQLAKDMGCLPPRTDKLSTWLSDPTLAYHLAFGPLCPSQYTLAAGHGISPEANTIARAIVTKSKL